MGSLCQQQWLHFHPIFWCGFVDRRGTPGTLVLTFHFLQGGSTFVSIRFSFTNCSSSHENCMVLGFVRLVFVWFGSILEGFFSCLVWCVPVCVFIYKWDIPADLPISINSLHNIKCGLFLEKKRGGRRTWKDNSWWNVTEPAFWLPLSSWKQSELLRLRSCPRWVTCPQTAVCPAVPKLSLHFSKDQG